MRSSKFRRIFFWFDGYDTIEGSCTKHVNFNLPAAFTLLLIIDHTTVLVYSFSHILSSSSSSCSWRVRRVSCSLILKMKLVPPSLPRSSHVPSSFWLILWCLFLVLHLCPSSVRVVATFPGTVFFIYLSRKGSRGITPPILNLGTT